jgi:hypothetical protein
MDVGVRVPSHVGEASLHFFSTMTIFTLKESNILTQMLLVFT